MNYLWRYPLLRLTARAATLAAIAGGLLVSCKRGDEVKVPPSPPVPEPAAEGAPSEQHVADAFATVWDQIARTRDGEKTLAAWSQTHGSEQAADEAGLQFKHALRILLGDRAKTERVWPATQRTLMVELLEKRQPELGRKWHDKVFEPVLEHWGYGPIISPWASPEFPADGGPLSDGSMTVEEAEGIVVRFCLGMDKEYLEPGLATLAGEKQISEVSGPACDRALKDFFHVTIDEWLAGRGAADLDLPVALRKVMLRYHPEVAAALADFFAERFAEVVKYAQADIKRKLTDIARAEQLCAERLLRTDGGFWNADLSGLYRFTVDGNPVGLIDPKLARLDARPASLGSESPLPPAGAEDPHNLPNFALAAVRGTNGAALDPHHYAFCAWPLGYGRIGRQTYLLVDPGRVFVKDTDGKPIDRLPADLDADGWTSIDFNGALAVPVTGLDDPDPMKRIAGLNRVMGVKDENEAPPYNPNGPHISPAAAKALAAAFGDSDKFVRRRARQVAEYFGKPAIVEATPVIMAGLRSEDAAVRYDALLAVSALKIRSREVADIVVPLTGVRDRAERGAAFEALVLQKLDENSAKAVMAQAGQAIYVLHAEDMDGAIHYLGSRGALSMPFAHTLKAIATNTEDPKGVISPYPQEQAAAAYFRVSGDASLYVSCLLAELKQGGVDRDLMYKIGEVGPPAKAALPDLEKLLKNPDYSIDAPLFLYAIGRVSNIPKPTTLLLIPMLKDPGQSADALDVLAKLGPDAGGALEALRAQAARTSGVEREHILRTIAAVEGHPVEDR